MTFVELEFDEKSHVGAMYAADVAREIRRAFIAEKAERKITQQAVAEKIGTSRAVVNREIMGTENLTARRQAELLWAIGWEPHFQARKIAPKAGQNDNAPTSPTGDSQILLIGDSTQKVSSFTKEIVSYA